VDPGSLEKGDVGGGGGNAVAKGEDGGGGNRWYHISVAEVSEELIY
jgi:hypothetical protein